MYQTIEFLKKLGETLNRLVVQALLFIYYLIGIFLISLMANILKKDFFHGASWKKIKERDFDENKMY